VLRVFGALRIEKERSAVELGPPKQRAVLAVLALHCGRTVAAESLIDAVWGDTPPRTAGHSLQIYVSELRKVLGQVPAFRIETARPGYRLEAQEGSVDVVEFERLVALGTGSGDMAALERAMELSTAEPLQEFRHEAWARPHIGRLLQLRADGAVRLARAALDDDPRAALRWAEAALAAAPFDERGCELVMLSQYRLGRHAEALRTYDQFRHRLDEERGLVTTPALAQRYQQVLLHDPDLDAPPVVGVGGAGSSRRRRRLVAVATVAVLVAAASVAMAILGDGAGSPGRAVLLHNGLSQIQQQAEAGFELGVGRMGFTGSALDVGADAEEVEVTLDAGVDLVVAPAISFDIGAAAAAHPDTTFVAFDQVVEGHNVTSVIVNSHEASYLAGVAAALTTRTGTVGFVGGIDEELIWEFAAGFAAGVAATSPEVEVLTEYLAELPDFGEGYENAAAGEAAGRRMYTAGADVVFAAAGTSGLGVFQAAADVTSETGTFRWAIGVDTDQYETVWELPLSVNPERWVPHILTSVLKHSDVVIRDVVTAFAEGDLEPGVRTVGLAQGAGGLSYTGGFLDAHRQHLERVREQIVAGQIDVPCRPVDRQGRSSPERAHPCA
jgi:basic membrane protein A